MKDELERALIDNITYWNEEMGYRALWKAMEFLQSPRSKDSFKGKYESFNIRDDRKKKTKGMLSCAELCEKYNTPPHRLSFILRKNNLKGHIQGKYRMFDKETEMEIAKIIHTMAEKKKNVKRRAINTNPKY
jgi:hypothetical protein